MLGNVFRPLETFINASSNVIVIYLAFLYVTTELQNVLQLASASPVKLKASYLR